MIARKLITLAACSSMLMLGACATQNTPYAGGSHLDDGWGSGVEMTNAAQLANPEAPVTDEGPEGLDASTGERVAERYYKGQDTQQTRKARSIVIAD